MNFQFSKIDRGFTLIELLVVITIIALLIGIGSYSWDKARQKARDNRRKQDLHAIKGALALYWNDDKNEYPPVLNSPLLCPGTPTHDEMREFSSDCADIWIPDLATTYIQKLPKDPLQGSVTIPIYCKPIIKIYCYQVANDRKKYFLWAKLENKNDPELYNRPESKCPGATAPEDFNYCIQNDF